WLAGLAPHTRRAYFRDLAHFLTWCQRDGLDPRAARAADLAGYRATLEHPAHGHPPAPASVHRRLSALSSWYRHLIANGDGEVAANPLAGVRRPRVDRDASTTAGLTADQVRALLAQADTVVAARAADLAHSPTPYRRARHLAALRDRALLRLLADLGLRVGEALALDTDALSHNQGQRTVRYLGKGGKQRERALSPQAAQALDADLASRATAGAPPTGPLFATTGPCGRASLRSPALAPWRAGGAAAARRPSRGPPARRRRPASPPPAASPPTRPATPSPPTPADWGSHSKTCRTPWATPTRVPPAAT